MGFLKKLAQSLLELSGWKRPRKRKSYSKKRGKKKTLSARKKKSPTSKSRKSVSKKKSPVKKSVSRKKAASKPLKKTVRKVKTPKKTVPVKSKKRLKTKTAVKKPAVRKSAKSALREIYVGEITHYFSNAGAAAFVVEKGTIEIGNQLKFSGHTTDFSQMLFSMQINRKPIEKAKAGDEVGIEVQKRVRPGDKIYKLVK